MPWPCDPCDLAEGIGLEPCPARVLAPIQCGNTLLFPPTLSYGVRGVGVLLVVARFALQMCSTSSVDAERDLAMELVLPADAALTMSEGDAAAVQAYCSPVAVRQAWRWQRRGSVHVLHIA